MTSLSDPNRGTHSYTYDPNGRVLTDISGTRTIGISYDLLGRAGCGPDDRRLGQLQQRQPSPGVEHLRYQRAGHSGQHRFPRAAAHAEHRHHLL